MPDNEFRHRAHEVSRLEAFSDVVFGFAISLLVVSLEAPKSYHELIETMYGVIPFGICFFLFIDIWLEHHNFFRRYALQDDRRVVVLNTLLLFVVLFYVYPLKYVFVTFVGSLRGIHSDLTQSDMPVLFTIYGLGFGVLFALIGLLNHRAWQLRDALQLNEIERLYTKESMADNFVMAGFGVTSAILANVLPARLAGWAGFFYFLIAVPKTIIPMVFGRARAARSTLPTAQPTES
jgi:uncharacterized membrane protein